MTKQRLKINKSRYVLLIILIIIAAVSYLYLNNIKMGGSEVVALDFDDLEIEIRQGPGRCYPEDCRSRAIEVSEDGEILSSVIYHKSKIKKQITGRLIDGDFHELATALNHHGFSSFEAGEFCTIPILGVGSVYVRIKVEGLEHESIDCAKTWPDSNGDKLVDKIYFIVDKALLREFEGKE